MNIVLWIIQVLLTLLFLLGGVTKFTMPIDEMVKQSGLSALLLRFIGICELLGALGLILPGLLRIRTGLTPLAALGLLIIMIGATVITLKSAGLAMALTPLVTGLLCAFVAYGRWKLAPHRSR